APVSIALRAPMGWLGPGRLVEDVLVVAEGARVTYAGPRVAYPRDGEVEHVTRVDGFLMPGVVDRHVHIGLADPGAVVAGGVTAVRDLGWPPDVIFSLAEASESPSFTGPLIRAAGAMITAYGGYPTRAGWGPTGTGLEVRGPEEAAAAAHDLLDRGAVVLKVALNADVGPTLSDDELVAVCDVAHGAETIVTANVQGAGP